MDGLFTPPAPPRPFVLDAGEHIVWQGRPRRGIAWRGADLGLVPFSLMWGGFAIFWNVSVWRDGAPWFFRLWGLPFLVIGLYLIVGRFFVDAALRRRLFYFVTNRRVVIVRTIGPVRIRSIDIARLPVLDVEERGDGSGTLRFGERVSVFGGSGGQVWSPALDPTLQFLHIDDVRKIADLIRRQQT